LLTPFEATIVRFLSTTTVAKAQNTELKAGDILLVRTGFIRWHENEKDLAKLKANTQVRVRTL
jgi:quercetin dioxygenase-like cupin family protein